jgi:hypothetical protein
MPERDPLFNRLANTETICLLDALPHPLPDWFFWRRRTRRMITYEKITELQRKGFCVLRAHLPALLIEACREALWPILFRYLESIVKNPTVDRIAILCRCPLSRLASRQNSSSTRGC